MTSDLRIAMGGAMTFRAIQKIAPADFSDEGLNAVDAAFAKLLVR